VGMPVVVVGASGLIGHAVVRAMARDAPEVRVFVRRADAAEPLRALGAKVAVGELHDASTLRAVLRDAHTVCHLVGAINLDTPEAYKRANLDSVLWCLDAATRAGVQRFLFVSSVGADASSDHPFLGAKGLAERAIADSGIEHAILRCTHVFGLGGEWFTAVVEGAARRPAVVIGTGGQVVAPVFVEDVAATLAAADDRRESVSGTWTLEGPERLSADAFCDLLAGLAVQKRHIGPESAGEASQLLGLPLSTFACRLFASDSIASGGQPDASGAFGVARTPLRVGLARTLERAEAAGLER